MTGESFILDSLAIYMQSFQLNKNYLTRILLKPMIP